MHYELPTAELLNCVAGSYYRVVCVVWNLRHLRNDMASTAVHSYQIYLAHKYTFAAFRQCIKLMSASS